MFSSRIDQSLRRADGIITISHFSQEQILKRFSLDEGKIHVTHLGIDHNFWRDITQDEKERIRSKFDLPSSYLLFVGAQEPRKNIGKLIDALKIIHNEYERIPLVLVGGEGKDSACVRDRIKELDLQQWVALTGYLNDFELRSIYQLGTAFVFPSVCEGFGLPLLEAMVSGIPVIASKAPALPEICQDAALFFDPEHPKDMAESIIRVLKDETLREDLIQRGKKRVEDFSWESTANKTLSIYRSLMSKT